MFKSTNTYFPQGLKEKEWSGKDGLFLSVDEHEIR